MIVKESFRRGEELKCELRHLPAALYNRTRLLLKRSETDCVFVPIRSMQYQAVIDADEIIFVDGLGPRRVELAWRGFKPQTRQSLEDTVPYELVIYTPCALDTMRRLHNEFGGALLLLEQRLKEQHPGTDYGTVVNFAQR